MKNPRFRRAANAAARALAWLASIGRRALPFGSVARRRELDDALRYATAYKRDVVKAVVAHGCPRCAYADFCPATCDFAPYYAGARSLGWNHD